MEVAVWVFLCKPESRFLCFRIIDGDRERFDVLLVGSERFEGDNFHLPNYLIYLTTETTTSATSLPTLACPSTVDAPICGENEIFFVLRMASLSSGSFSKTS